MDVMQREEGRADGDGPKTEELSEFRVHVDHSDVSELEAASVTYQTIKK